MTDHQRPSRPWALWISSGCYLGYVPWAPGTFGTLAGIPAFFLLSRLPLWGYLLALPVVVAVAVYAADEAEEIYDGHDDPRIVIDEVAGFLVTMIGAPVSWMSVGLGFGLFRLFDIVKPWPCSAIDRNAGGGAGVVLDDLAAGLYGLIALQSILNIIDYWTVL